MSSEQGSSATATTGRRHRLSNGHSNGHTNGHPRKIEEVEVGHHPLRGDSGDGMQLAGTQFTNTSAILGNDISTLPDFPAEIRAPPAPSPASPASRSTSPATDIYTPGDELDTLVAMNPAALKTNLKRPRSRRHPDRQHRRLRRPATCTRPATRPTRSRTARSRATALIRVPITKLNREAVAELQAQPARGRPLQELLRPGPGLLALRAAAGPDAQAGSSDKFGKKPGRRSRPTPAR